MNATRANALISAAILARIEQGATMQDAVDAVLGAGQYDAIVTSVYHALRGEG